MSIHQVQARRNREIDKSQSGQSNNLQAGVPTWPLASNAIAESIAMSQSETLPPSVNMRRIAVNFIGYGVLVEYLFPHRKQENRRVIDDEMVAPAQQPFSLPPCLSLTHSLSMAHWPQLFSCATNRPIDQSSLQLRGNAQWCRLRRRRSDVAKFSKPRSNQVFHRRQDKNMKIVKYFLARFIQFSFIACRS